MINVIIIDDEAKSREVLKNLLTTFCNGVNVVDMADDIQSGIDSIKMHQPDVVFFDISLKTGDSFEIIDKLGFINFQPVFVTAFDEYSVKALNYSNLPCMFKPIDIDDLETMVEELKAKKFTEFNKRYKEARALMNSSFETIPIKHKNGLLMLDIKKIIYIKSGKKNQKIVCDKEEFESNKSFMIFKEILLPKNFLIIQNIYILNPAYVNIDKSTDSKIILINGKKLS